MAISNKQNVTLRLDLNRPMNTYEMDANLQEIKNIIDDLIAGNVGTSGTASFNLSSEFFQPTAGTTVLTLENTYEVGSDNLQVYQNGIKLVKDEHYVELNSNQVGLNDGTLEGDELEVVIGRPVASNELLNYDIKNEQITLSVGETQINTANSFTVNNNTVSVYYLGVKLLKDTDYTEVGTNRIDLVDPSPGGVYEIVMGQAVTSESSVTDARVSVTREIAIGTPGETTVAFSSINYTIGDHNLMVVRNGAVLTEGIDYTESSTVSIDLLVPYEAEDELVVYHGLVLTNDEGNASTTRVVDITGVSNVQTRLDRQRVHYFQTLIPAAVGSGANGLFIDDIYEVQYFDSAKEDNTKGSWRCTNNNIVTTTFGTPTGTESSVKYWLRDGAIYIERALNVAYKLVPINETKLGTTFGTGFNDLTGRVSRIGSEVGKVYETSGASVEGDLGEGSWKCVQVNITLPAGSKVLRDSVYFYEGRLYIPTDDSNYASLEPTTDKINARIYGGNWDGLESDLIPLEAAVSSGKKTIILPPKIALESTAQLKGNGTNFIFQDTQVYALPGNSFNEVIQFGSGTGTGRYVVLSFGDDSGGCINCNFYGRVDFENAASGHSNLVGFAAETLGNGYQNHWLGVIRAQSTAYVYAIYGQSTTVAVPGSFTGSTINAIETGSGIGAFNLASNQDDVTIRSIRDKGTSNLSNMLTVDSYFMFGSDNTNSTDGLVLGAFAKLKCNHHFIEGDFRHPILMNGSDASYDSEVMVSPNFSSSAGGGDFLITTNVNDVFVNIREEPKSRQGACAGYVARAASTNNRGRFNFELTTAIGETDYIEPIAYTGAASSEDIIFIETTNDKLNGIYSNSTISYRRYSEESNSVVDDTGATVYTLPYAGLGTISVANSGRYSISNQKKAIIGLDSTSNVTIFLFNASGALTGIPITLFASGAGNVTIARDGTSEISFQGGANNFTLLGGTGNNITIMFDGSRWQQIGSQTF